jgi:hypothetical protein
MTKTQRVPERVLYFIFVKDPLNTEHIFVWQAHISCKLVS